MPESFLKKALRGFEPYVPGEQPPDDEGWVKLNTNESPLPPSPKVIEAIKAAADDSLRLYPSPTAAPAREAIAAHFDLEPSQVALGNGGDELIEMCFRAFAGAGDRVAYPHADLPAVRAAVPRSTRRFRRRIRAAKAGPGPSELVDDQAPLKFIVNPNSPTGTWSTEAAVEQVVARRTGVVVLDEAYVDFAPESCIGLLARHRQPAHPADVLQVLRAGRDADRVRARRARS